MSDTAISEFLDSNSSNGYESAKFATLGTVHKGTIIEKPSVVTTDRIGKPGEKQQSLVIAIQDGDNDPINVWVKAGQMTSALKAALGSHKLTVGDTIAFKFASESPSKTPGYSPMKTYQVSHKPAAGSVDVTDLLG